MNDAIGFWIARSVPVILASVLVLPAPNVYGWADSERVSPAGVEKPGIARTADGAQPSPDSAKIATLGSDADHPKPGARIDAEKLRRFAWGPPATNGLRAACYFEPTKEAYTDGEIVNRRVVLHNSGQESVLLAVGGSNSGGLAVIDDQDQKVPLEQRFAYGKLRLETFRLEPGQAVETKCMAVGMGVSTSLRHPMDTVIQAKPGTTCRVRLMVQVTDLAPRSADGHGTPAGGLRLMTGEVRFRIVKPAVAGQ